MRAFLGFSVVLALAILGGSRATAFAQSESPALPDAPQAQIVDAPVPGGIEDSKPQPTANRYAHVIQPGQDAQRLSAGDKLIVAARAELSPVVILSAAFSAGYEQLTDDDPNYGSDEPAFGKRFGAAVLRHTSTEFLADGVFPALLHQDPRYYRLGVGHTVMKRGLYAAERVMITRQDSGRNNFNYSTVLGELAASGLTQAYYPERSRSVGVVMNNWLTGFAFDAAWNGFHEFWPDLKHHYLHRD
jgi:hypothetical protein